MRNILKIAYTFVFKNTSITNTGIYVTGNNQHPCCREEQKQNFMLLYILYTRVDQIFRLSCLRRHVLGWVKKRLHSYSNFFKVRLVVGTHFSHISSQNRFCLFISDPGGGFFLKSVENLMALSL